MKKIDVLDQVKPPKSVRFEYYREGVLYYSTDDGTVFPVPADDLPGATFLATDRAMLYMRWMRKHNDAIEAAQAGTEVQQ
jgi:hypothetical protein